MENVFHLCLCGPGDFLGCLSVGLGGSVHDVTTFGPWSDADSRRHMNELELLGALFPCSLSPVYLGPCRFIFI